LYEECADRTKKRRRKISAPTARSGPKQRTRGPTVEQGDHHVTTTHPQDEHSPHT
jgi:hypothetical protein